MTDTYRIVRRFANGDDTEVIEEGLTLEEARQHCNDPDTSSRTCTTAKGQKLTKKRGPWFDAYEQE